MFKTAKTFRAEFLSACAGVALLLLASGVAMAQEALPGTAWLAEDIDGKGVIDNLQTTMEVSRDGKLSGNAGCNSYSGTPEIAGDAITIGPMAMTRMACLPAVDEQERRFLDALGETKSYRIEGDLLYFLDGEGNTLIRFSKLPS